MKSLAIRWRALVMGVVLVLMCAHGAMAQTFLGAELSLSPATVNPGDTVTATITFTSIDGQGFPAFGVTAILPAPLVWVGPGQSSCGGVVSAAGSTLTMGGGDIPQMSPYPPNPQTCVITALVQWQAGSCTSPSLDVTIPRAQMTSSNSGSLPPSPLSATLNCQARAPAVPLNGTLAFSAATTAPGGVVTATLTLSSVDGLAYPGLGVSANLPAPLVWAGAVQSSCGGTASSTGSSLTLAGGDIPASAAPNPPVPETCVVSGPVRWAAASCTPFQVTFDVAPSQITTTGSGLPPTAGLSAALACRAGAQPPLQPVPGVGAMGLGLLSVLLGWLGLGRLGVRRR